MGLYVLSHIGSVPLLFNSTAVLEVIELEECYGANLEDSMASGQIKWRKEMLRVIDCDEFFGLQASERLSRRVGLVYQFDVNKDVALLLVDEVEKIVPLEEQRFIKVASMPQQALNLLDGVYPDKEKQMYRVKWPMVQSFGADYQLA